MINDCRPLSEQLTHLSASGFRSIAPYFRLREFVWVTTQLPRMPRANYSWGPSVASWPVSSSTPPLAGGSESRSTSSVLSSLPLLLLGGLFSSCVIINLAKSTVFFSTFPLRKRRLFGYLSATPNRTKSKTSSLSLHPTVELPSLVVTSELPNTITERRGR